MIGGKAVAKTKSVGFLVRMFNTQFNCLSGNQPVLPTGTVESELCIPRVVHLEFFSVLTLLTACS